MARHPSTKDKLPMFLGAYRLMVGKANGSSGEYDVWKVKRSGFVQEQDAVQTERHYHQLDDKNIVLDDNE
jgi:hypothetical protein